MLYAWGFRYTVPSCQVSTCERHIILSDENRCKWKCWFIKCNKIECTTPAPIYYTTSVVYILVSHTFWQKNCLCLACWRSFVEARDAIIASWLKVANIIAASCFIKSFLMGFRKKNQSSIYSVKTIKWKVLYRAGDIEFKLSHCYRALGVWEGVLVTTFHSVVRQKWRQ